MKKNDKKVIGDFLFDIKVFDLPNGGIVDKMKLETDKDEWQTFLEKFGINVIKGDKNNAKVRIQKEPKPTRRKRTIFDS